MSFGVRLAIPAFQARSDPMANSANPDLHGMMSYIWVVARIEDTFRMDMGRTGDIQAFGVEETLKKKGEGQKKKAKQSKAKKSPKRGSSPSSIRGIN